MTVKTFDLKERKDIKEIEKGTMLKRLGDLFIVSEVKREIVDPIHDAIFLSNPPKPYYSYSERGKRESKYALISLSTGGNYFNSVDTLPVLLRKIVEDKKFEIVDSIEFKEVN